MWSDQKSEREIATSISLTLDPAVCMYDIMFLNVRFVQKMYACIYYSRYYVTLRIVVLYSSEKEHKKKSGIKTLDVDAMLKRVIDLRSFVHYEYCV